MTAIAFPHYPDPAATIVMPVYGARADVELSLRALLANTTVPHDVVIVDNASPDGATEWLQNNVTGVDLVCNPANMGFGAACNQGAHRASADVVVFLNSDAFVEPGWLEPLIETVGLPGAAAASARLHHPDGRLQEAGALIGPDGIGVAYGNTYPADRFQFRFRRTVDYASGTVLAVRRRVFLEHGGFDPAFGLAYCEDVDLSMRFRAAGWSTYYEPRAVAVHVQGASSPPDHIRALLERNTAILRERWHDVLSIRPPLTDLRQYPHRTLESRDACAPDRLLVLCDTLPSATGTDGRTGRFLMELATARPDARIAVCTPTPVAAGSSVDRWCELGVEIGEDPDGMEIWLRDRMGGFGAVIAADPHAATILGPRTRMTQPQAEWLAPERMAEGVELLAAMGWAPAPQDPSPHRTPLAP